MDKELQDKLDLIRNDITMMTDASEDLAHELENDKPRIISAQDAIIFADKVTDWLTQQKRDLTITRSEAGQLQSMLVTLSTLMTDIVLVNFAD